MRARDWGMAGGAHGHAHPAVVSSCISSRFFLYGPRGPREATSLTFCNFPNGLPLPPSVPFIRRPTGIASPSPFLETELAQGPSGFPGKKPSFSAPLNGSAAFDSLAGPHSGKPPSLALWGSRSPQAPPAWLSLLSCPPALQSGVWRCWALLLGLSLPSVCAPQGATSGPCTFSLGRTPKAVSPPLFHVEKKKSEMKIQRKDFPKASKLVEADFPLLQIRSDQAGAGRREGREAFYWGGGRGWGGE